MMTMASVTERAANALARRFDRRGFLARSAVVGSALAVAPTDLVFRPTSAYAAVCGCGGKTCTCGSLCCDGYTEFCCTLYGANACPPDTVAGGWWKVDASSYCSGSARYYIDCHRQCGSCGCGSAGVCSGTCNGTGCGCGNGSCANRKAGCTHFRYGNCNNQLRCVGPIVCRLVTCTRPWKLDATCSATAVRTDNNTRSHNRSCLQVTRIEPVTGDWNGNAVDGVGFYANHDGGWDLRQGPFSGSTSIAFTLGIIPGDQPVVGDWNGDGVDGVGIYRNSDGSWHLRNTAAGQGTSIDFTFGRLPGDQPVTGDWNGDGIDGIGVFRNKEGKWYLRDTASGGSAERVISFAKGSGDIPVVGDWDGDGIDGIGVYRPKEGRWYLKQKPTSGVSTIQFTFGLEKGDIPVVGDWDGDGVDGVGIFRPREGRWYLRDRWNDVTSTKVLYGPKWFVG